MSDIQNPVDNATETVATSPAVAPSNQTGEQQGSTPATADTAASETAKPEGESPEAKQSRRASREFANLRRENRDLYRRLGGLETMLETRQSPQASEGEQPQQRQVLTPQEAAAKRRDDAAARMVVERLEEAGDEIEGFDKVMQTITGNFPMTAVMRDFLGDAEQPAHMAKWLSENPGEAQRISLMSDAVAVRALERAERNLSAKPAPKTTNASPPVPTVGGRSTASFDPGAASMDEYAAHWTARQAKR